MKPSVGVIFWLAAVVVWLTWAPFVARSGPATVTFDPYGGPGVAMANLLLFAPLGALVALRAPRQKSVAWCGLISLCVAFGGSLLVETGQLFVEGRTVTPWDLLFNSAGGGTAGLLAAAARTRGMRTTQLTMGVILLVFVCCAFVLSWAAWTAQDGFALRSWMPGYEVVVGDEVGGERRYRGIVHRAEICTNASDGTWCLEEGADQAERSRFVEDVEASQFLLVTAEFTSTAAEQRGPARIATFSQGPPLRNLTLGQEANDLVVRVRTPVTGPNGVGPEFGLPGVVSRGVATEARVEYHRGVLRVAVSSAGLSQTADFRFGLLDAWVLRWPVGSVIPGTLSRARWTGAMVLLFPAGLLLGTMLVSRVKAGAVAAVLTIGTLGVAELVLTGRFPVLESALVSATAGFIGAVIARRDEP